MRQTPEGHLTSRFVVNHSGKVLDAKLRLVVVLRRDVVCVEFVLEVQLVQHGGVRPLQDTQRQRQTLRVCSSLTR